MIHTRITDNRVQILSLANQHGTKSMKIFSSMARGDASETSDADFLVEMEDGYDLFDLGSCLMELKDNRVYFEHILLCIEKIEDYTKMDKSLYWDQPLFRML